MEIPSELRLRTPRQWLAAWLILWMVQPVFVVPAWADLESPTVVSGSVDIPADLAGAQVDITVSDPRTVVNWEQFGIPAGQTVTIEHSNAGQAFEMLNQVVSAVPEISQIDGTLSSSSGHIYIVNPAGVIFGQGGMVNVAGLVAAAAATLDDQAAQAWAADALADLNLTLPQGFFAPGSESERRVENAGAIEATGPVMLLARAVRNFGSIVAPGGVVVLAAGERAVVGDPATGIFVSIETDGFQEAANEAGATIEADKVAIIGGSVRNAGSVTATEAVVYAAGPEVSVDLTGEPVVNVSTPPDFADPNANALDHSGSTDAGSGQVIMRVGDVYAFAFHSIGGTIDAGRIDVATESGNVDIDGELRADQVDVAATGSGQFNDGRVRFNSGDREGAAITAGTANVSGTRITGVGDTSVPEVVADAIRLDSESTVDSMLVAAPDDTPATTETSLGGSSRGDVNVTETGQRGFDRIEWSVDDLQEGEALNIELIAPAEQIRVSAEPLDPNTSTGTISTPIYRIETGDIAGDGRDVTIVANGAQTVAIDEGGVDVGASGSFDLSSDSTITPGVAQDPDATNVTAGTLALSADRGIDLAIDAATINARTNAGNVDLTNNHSGNVALETLTSDARGSASYQQTGPGDLTVGTARADLLVFLSANGSIEDDGATGPDGGDLVDVTAGSAVIESLAGSVGAQNRLEVSAEFLRTSASADDQSVTLDLVADSTTVAFADADRRLELRSSNDLIVGGQVSADEILLHAGSDGTGNLGFSELIVDVAQPGGPQAAIGDIVVIGDDITLRAGDGPGGDATASVALGDARFEGSDGGRVSRFLLQQDAAIADATELARFQPQDPNAPAIPPADLTLQSDDATVTVADGTRVEVPAGEARVALTLIGSGNDPTADVSINAGSGGLLEVASLTIGGDAQVSGSIDSEGAVRVTDAAALRGSGTPETTDLDMTGSLVASEVSVDGEARVGGALTTNSGDAIADSWDVGGNADVATDFVADGSPEDGSGGIEVGGSLESGADTTANGAVRARSIEVGRDLDAGANVETTGGSVNVVGLARVGAALDVNGLADPNGPQVRGDATAAQWDVTGDADVDNDFVASAGPMTVGGAVTVGEDLEVRTAIAPDGPSPGSFGAARLDVTGNADVDGDLGTSAGDALVGGTANVGGALSTTAGNDQAGDARAGSWTVGTTADTAGDLVSTTGDTVVTGAATVGNDLDSAGNATAASWNVTGGAAADGDLRSTTGDLVAGGAVDAGGALDSAGNASGQSLAAGTTLDTVGNATATGGNVTAGGTANVGGALSTTAGNDQAGDARAGSWTVGTTADTAGDLVSTTGDTAVTGVATVGNDLDSAGNATAASWNVTGGAAADGDLRSTTGDLVAGGAVDAGGALDSAGNASGQSLAAGTTLDTVGNATATGGGISAGGAGNVGGSLTTSAGDASGAATASSWNVAGDADVDGDFAATTGGTDVAGNTRFAGNLTAQTGLSLGGSVAASGEGVQTIDGGTQVEFDGAGAQSLTAADGVALQTSNDAGSDTTLANIFKANGDLELNAPGSVVVADKVTVANGNLLINAGSAQLGDLNASGTITVNAGSINVGGRAPGPAFTPDGSAIVGDGGTDINASQVNFNVAPAVGGPVTIGTPDGDNVSAALLGAAVNRRALGAPLVLGARNDVTPLGESGVNPTEGNQITETLADLGVQAGVLPIIDLPGGSLLPVRADDVLAFIECIRLEGDETPRPEDCPDAYENLPAVTVAGDLPAVEVLGEDGPALPAVAAAPPTTPAPVASVAISPPLGSAARPASRPQIAALRTYRRLKNEPVTTTLAQAAEDFRNDTGVSEISGRDFRSYLEESDKHRQARQYLEQINSMLGSLRQAGMTQPQFLRVAKRVLTGMAPDSIPWQQLGIAAEGGDDAADWPTLQRGLTASDWTAPPPIAASDGGE